MANKQTNIKQEKQEENPVFVPVFQFVKANSDPACSVYAAHWQEMCTRGESSKR